MLSDAILLSLIGSGVAVIGLILKYNYLSKCFHIRCCWGLVDAERDTKNEQSIEVINNTTNTTSNNNIPAVPAPSPAVGVSFRGL